MEMDEGERANDDYYDDSDDFEDAPSGIIGSQDGPNKRKHGVRREWNHVLVNVDQQAFQEIRYRSIVTVMSQYCSAV